jgi:hypothetical protein
VKFGSSMRTIAANIFLPVQMRVHARMVPALEELNVHRYRLCFEKEREKDLNGKSEEWNSDSFCRSSI